MTSASAQPDGCAPNVQYQDSTFGVYPAPYHVDNNPDGGIQDKACVNTPYYFTWTIKIPESVEILGFTINVDSVRLEETGAISNLPTGLEYSFNPSSGLFTPADSLACLTIFGSPEAIGSYDLKITLTIYSQDLLILGSNAYEATLPDPAFPATDGQYLLAVSYTHLTLPTNREV